MITDFYGYWYNIDIAHPRWNISRISFLPGQVGDCATVEQTTPRRTASLRSRQGSCFTFKHIQTQIYYLYFHSCPVYFSLKNRLTTPQLPFAPYKVRDSQNHVFYHQNIFHLPQTWFLVVTFIFEFILCRDVGWPCLKQLIGKTDFIYFEIVEIMKSMATSPVLTFQITRPIRTRQGNR